MISNSFIVLDTFWSLSRLMYIVSVILLNVLIVVHRFIAENHHWSQTSFFVNYKLLPWKKKKKVSGQL